MHSIVWHTWYMYVLNKLYLKQVQHGFLICRFWIGDIRHKSASVAQGKLGHFLFLHFLQDKDFLDQPLSLARVFVLVSIVVIRLLVLQLPRLSRQFMDHLYTSPVHFGAHAHQKIVDFDQA